tara:strand:+ start:688 stop:888 length:201 start_codon:yes stop_codon:yes gene_type:complete
MSRKYINTVEKAVSKIGILVANKTVDEITEIDWDKVQDNILIIESHVKDLVHLCDLKDMSKKSNYY